MNPRHRDGLLAAAGLAALLALGTARGVLRAFRSPAAAVGGVAGALALEVAFLRYPDRLLSAWERRGVPTASLLGVLGVGAAALRAAPAVVGALAWGLATYLALLACVLAGLGNPLAGVARRRRGE